MRLAARHDQPESLSIESLASEASTEQAIEQWLDIVARLSRINQRDRDELKDELSAHLHDRVRDLELAGHEEHAALKRAIAELGDAAQLARSISEAHRYPRRRLIMNCTLVGLGLAALGVGLVTFNGVASGGPGRAFETAQDTRVLHALPQDVSIEFNETLFAEAIEYLDAITDRSIYVHWDELSDYGIDRESDTTVNLTVNNIPLGRAMELLLMELPEGEVFAWRADDHLIELGTRESFDRRDTQLVSYDISKTLLTLWEEYDVELDQGRESIVTLLQDMVEPDNWVDNGGAIARHSVIGGTLFIQAPPRMHERVQWLLDELAADAGLVANRDDDGAPELTKSFKTGDDVTIEVFELFQTNQWTKRRGVVSEAVAIRFPQPLGEIDVIGKTPDEVEASVIARLSDVIVDPLVSVYHTPPSGSEELGDLKQQLRSLQEHVQDLSSQLAAAMTTNQDLREELQNAMERGAKPDNPDMLATESIGN